MLRYRKHLLFGNLILCAIFLIPFLLCTLLSKTQITTLGALFFLLYGLSISWLNYHLSLPMQQIVDLIRSFREKPGDINPSPSQNSIQNLMTRGTEEFGDLVLILNALTEKMRSQIEHVKQQRRSTEEILESLVEGVVAVDAGGHVTFANQAACAMLTAPSDAVIGSPFSRIPSPNAQLIEQCCQILQKTLQTSAMLQNCWVSHPKENGQQRHLELRAAPLVGQHGAILVIQDKTSDYKVLEMGKDFIANASHELRTPITVIRGFAETMQDYPSLPPPLLQEIGTKIVRTSERLDTLIQSLLTLADIENISKERFQLSDLVLISENCKHLLLTAHPKVQISFSSNYYRIPINADPQLLDLAILNLLENAVKYSPFPHRIRMTLSVSGEQGVLEIQDWGIGIPENDLPHIFDRFYTVDKARSRKSGGAGLGLSIVQTIIERHHGSITACSQLGQGSLFTITLPLPENGEQKALLKKSAP